MTKGFSMDELMNYIANQEEHTGLELEEVGLCSVIHSKGGSLSFKELDSISKESLEELKAIVSSIESKGYVSVTGNIVTLTKELPMFS
jgi:hypothetical protein